ncbi:hypothetical protein C0U44_31455, partial [Klebsiella pneumoniae]
MERRRSNAGATTINIPDTVGYTMPFVIVPTSVAGRTPIADLARVVERRRSNAGATTINIPDTVGYTMPFVIVPTSV